MKKLHKDIGKRLNYIRSIYLEGTKVSANQFGEILGESGDNIRNYELGRAGIPARLLVALYERGFNSNFILTGEGDIFAGNAEGKKCRELLENKKYRGLGVTSVRKIADSDGIASEKLAVYKVAAGKPRKKSDN